MWDAAAKQLYDDNLEAHFKKHLKNGKSRHSIFKTIHVLGKVYDALDEFFHDEKNNAAASKNCSHRVLYNRLTAHKEAQKLAEDKKKAAAEKKAYKTNALEEAECALGLRPDGYSNVKDELSGEVGRLTVAVDVVIVVAVVAVVCRVVVE